MPSRSFGNQAENRPLAAHRCDALRRARTITYLFYLLVERVLAVTFYYLLTTRSPAVRRAAGPERGDGRVGIAASPRPSRALLLSPGTRLRRRSGSGYVSAKYAGYLHRRSETEGSAMATPSTDHDRPIEAEKILTALDAVGPKSMTSCPGWSAHYVAAHIAGNYQACFPGTEPAAPHPQPTTWPAVPAVVGRTGAKPTPARSTAHLPPHDAVP
jgi:hypothetical protein